jgi:S-layer protein
VTFTSIATGARTDVVAGDFVVAQGTADTDAPDVASVAAPTTQGVTAVAAGALTLTKMANAGTLELTAAATTTTVTMTDATGTADSFNIVTKVGSADVAFGTVAVAGVETVNITATDTSPVNTTTGAATISKATLTVSDSAVKTIVVTGESDLDLTAAGASLTSVNASALTGKLVFSSDVNSAVITGGSAADTLTGSGNSQTLSGGDGADTLIITGDLAILSGGAGNDVFNIGNATTNVNSYATITDLAAGDVIKFTGAAADFVSAKVTLGDTAVFEDLANAAIANSEDGDVAWFQFGSNTYVIQNVATTVEGGGSNATSFLNNEDIIVKITGLVDLSTASFSSSADTLLIA